MNFPFSPLPVSIALLHPRLRALPDLLTLSFFYAGDTSHQGNGESLPLPPSFVVPREGLSSCPSPPHRLVQLLPVSERLVEKPSSYFIVFYPPLVCLSARAEITGVSLLSLPSLPPVILEA